MFPYSDFTSDTPYYNILEEIYDPITKKTWVKIKSNNAMSKLVRSSPCDHNWTIYYETSGVKYLKITKKLLTIMHLKGATRLPTI